MNCMEKDDDGLTGVSALRVRRNLQKGKARDTARGEQNASRGRMLESPRERGRDERRKSTELR